MNATASAWVCEVCGYVHEGPEPPETCPVCGAGAAAFVEVEDEEEETPETTGPETAWRCTICGYIEVGAAPPDRCPVCGAGADAFEETEPPSEPKEPPEPSDDVEWIAVAATDELPEGRVKTVSARDRSFALTHVDGKWSLLSNACPHQGGPLGEGSIEDGTLRCPWHGWRFDPVTGEMPGGGEGVEAFPVKVEEGSVSVGLPAEEPPAPRTASDLLIETMVAWGVTHVFGMVGHSNLGVAEAMRRQEEAGKLTYIGIRHEGAASFAASAYAKLTGRPAACLSIAGPGATNLLTGLWDARMDRVPILALTGQVDTQVLGPGAFQEADLTSAFAPVSAFSQTVLPDSRHAELMTLALKHAILERDVGHLIVPNGVGFQEVSADAKPSSPEGRLTGREIHPPDEAMEQAIERLRQAKRPVIIVGHGARFHMDPVVALAERLGCPVVTTFKGKGLISDHHPLACGTLGRSGTPVASHFMNESDLLVVFGASFSNHTGITPNRPTIQVDFDPMILGKFHPVTVPVYGEIGVTARLFGEALDGADVAASDRREEIAARWTIWRDEKASRRKDDRGRGISSATLFDALSRKIPEDAVIAVDVGNNTYSFGRYFECARQSVLMSGYLGSIGFGYPAAMGAWAAAPDRPIVAITGDGGFGQYMGELTTAVKYGMKITHVLLNNGELGKISKEQRAARLAVWQTALHNPDFSKYAESCGALGLRVTDAAALDGALEGALSHGGPSLVEVMTDVELI